MQPLLRAHDLAHETDFHIGQLWVRPSLRRIGGPDGERTVEPKVMQVLVSLAHAKGEILSRDDLIERCWEGRIVGDNSINRVMSLLRAALRDAGAEQVEIETISKVGFRLKGEIRAAGSAKGMRDQTFQNDVSTHLEIAQPTRRTGSKLSLYLFGGLLAALSVWWAMSARNASNIPEPEQSVEINAFHIGDIVGADASSEAEAESLRAQLAEYLNAYRMATRMDATSISGDISEFTLEGRVDRSRAVLRMVETQSREVIWSYTSDRPSHPIADHANILASRTAKVARCLARVRSPNYISEPKTLLLYARNCEDSVLGGVRMDTRLTEAIHLAEPDNPYAAALHARALFVRAGWDDELSLDQRQTLRDAAEAIRVDLVASDFADPQGALLSASAYIGAPDRVQSEAELRHAVAKETIPGTASERYAEFLRTVGRIEDATDIYSDIANAHPADAAVLSRYGWLLLTQGEKRRAEEALSAAEQLEPDWPELLERRLQFEEYLGDPKRALEMLDNGAYDNLRTERDVRCSRAFQKPRIDQMPTGETFANLCHRLGAGDFWWVMRMHVGLGELDKAFSLAEQGDWSMSGSTIVLFYPDMAPAWKDERFWSLMERIGINDYWSTTGSWPDFCDRPALDIDCERLSDLGRRRALEDEGRASASREATEFGNQ